MAVPSKDSPADDRQGAPPAATHPDRPAVVTEPDPEEVQDAGLAEALDGLSQMLGVED